MPIRGALLAARRFSRLPPGVIHLLHEGDCERAMWRASSLTEEVVTVSATSSGKSPATSGLEGIVAASTEMSDVDGQGSPDDARIQHRRGGRPATFEEPPTSSGTGRCPTQAELTASSGDSSATAPAGRDGGGVQLAAKRMEPMDALRFAVASLTADDPTRTTTRARPNSAAPRSWWPACRSSSGSTSGCATGGKAVGAARRSRHRRELPVPD